MSDFRTGKQSADYTEGEGQLKSSPKNLDGIKLCKNSYSLAERSPECELVSVFSRRIRGLIGVQALRFSGKEALCETHILVSLKCLTCVPTDYLRGLSLFLS